MGKVSHHHFPEPDDYDTWVDMGPEQEEDLPAGFVPTFIVGLAQLASIVLFGCMIAAWSMIADGRFPEVPQ